MYRFRARHVLQNDRGIALPMALLVFFLSVALVAAFLVAIVGSSTVTATSKSIVQAQAAAEAGVAYAETQMRGLNDPCAATLTDSPASPEYRFSEVNPICDEDGQITIRSTGFARSGEYALTVEATWEHRVLTEQAEEPNASLILVGGSESFGNHPGLIMYNPSEGETQLTAVDSRFDCNGLDIPGSLVGGDDVYLNSCKVRGDVLLAGEIDSNNSSNNRVEGDLRAAGTGDHRISGTITGAVYVNGAIDVHGTTRVSGRLTVAGPGRSTVQSNAVIGADATFAGDVALNQNARVDGDLTIAGTGKSDIRGIVAGDLYVGGTVEIYGSAQIMGDVFVAGTGQGIVRSNLDGDYVSPGSLQMASWHTNIAGRVMVGNSASFIGNNRVGQGLSGCVVASAQGVSQITYPQGNAGNLTESNTCRLETVPAVAVPQSPALTTPPDLPAWKSYQFDEEDWPGFDVQEFSGSECSDWTGWPGDGWGAVGAIDEPTVFDLRECDFITTNGGRSDYKHQVIGHDVVFLINEMQWNSTYISAAPGTTPRLWVVTPETSATAGPNCDTRSRSFTLVNSGINEPVRGMIYTPCEVHFNGARWQGNVYAGTMETLGGTTTLTFDGMGLPNWTGDEDDTIVVIGSEVGDLLTHRNVSE